MQSLEILCGDGILAAVRCSDVGDPCVVLEDL